MSLCFTAITASPAHAEEDEFRLSLVAGGTVTELEAFSAATTTETYGGGLTVAYGIFNWLEIGLSSGYQRRTGFSIADAQVGDIGGAPAGRYELFTDMQVVSAAASARLYLEAGPFLRFRPLLGGRIGAQLASFSNAQLFTVQGVPASAGSETATEFSLLRAADIGAAYRLSDGYEVALIASSERSDTQTTYGLRLEVSWMH